MRLEGSRFEHAIDVGSAIGGCRHPASLLPEGGVMEAAGEIELTVRILTLVGMRMVLSI